MIPSELVVLPYLVNTVGHEMVILALVITNPVKANSEGSRAGYCPNAAVY